MVRLTPVLPAVTCSVQSSMLTGRLPAEHGVVGNGWFDRDLADVHFWKQSNRLVEGDKVWHQGRRRDRRFTCAQLFWWYNMYADVDVSATPRPMYKADGRKLPDVYTDPPALRDTLQARFGTFPLFNFWGPMAGIASTRWIVNAARHVEDAHAPTLSLVYLPHLDYALQARGPDHPSIPAEVRAADEEVGRLLDHYAERAVNVLIVSEYAIEPVTTPVHVNRVLRDAGFVRVRVEEGLELLDPGASRAFAVADHQIAHVYVRDPADGARVADVLSGIEGVESVLDEAGKRAAGLDHARAGEFVLIAAPGHWFTYYYWLEDTRAPDFARTVDIHRKPGYDPVELFLDPRIRAPKVRVGLKLLAKRLGFRTLMDVIPLDASLVRGSHGRVPSQTEDAPLLISAHADRVPGGASLPVTVVRDVILAHVFGS